MAFKNGRLYTCDRCGETVFCECTGEKERDGGFTRWNTFEPLPDGWGCCQDSRKLTNICPSCNEKYQRLIQTFENVGQEERKLKIVSVRFDGNYSKAYDYEYIGDKPVSIGDFVNVKTERQGVQAVEVVNVFEILESQAKYDYKKAVKGEFEVE